MTPDDPKFRGFLIQKLRGASRFCEQYNQVLKNANRGRNKYECAECKNIFPRKMMKRDHKIPIILVTGFDSWDKVIERLFVGIDGWQALCKPCHDIKTKIENAERRACKKEKRMLELENAKKKEILI